MPSIARNILEQTCEASVDETEAAQADNGADVHHRSAADHQVERRLDAVHRTGEVGGQHGIPVGGFEPCQPAPAVQAGVVDQHVETAPDRADTGKGFSDRG